MLEGAGVESDMVGDLTGGASVTWECEVVSDSAFLFLLCRLVKRLLSSFD